MTINVFTQPNCQPCRMTKRWLNKHGIKFNELNISDYADVLRERGYQSAPVVQIIQPNGDEVTWSGSFDIKKLQQYCLTNAH